MKFTIAVSSLMFAAHSSARDDMGILVNSHNKKRYLKKDQYFERQEYKDKGTNRNRTKVPRDRPERVQVGSDNGQVDIAPLQQAVASFVKEEEDPYFGCPPSDIVDCDDGFLRGSGTTTCQAECDGKCCVGTTTDPNACERFTGKVCKDKKSCIGRDACVDADIGLVVGGCTGDLSCEEAYIKHGVIRGCISPFACNEAGAFKAGSGTSGYVGRIKDGCVGDNVCRQMGYGFSSDAFVGFVDNGCVGGGFSDTGTCYKLGYDGRVGSIKNACKQFNACYKLAYENDGFVGSIERACIGKASCGRVASYGGYVGSIKDSCKGRDTCYGVADNGGNVGSIQDSCKGEEACYFAAQDGGYITFIDKSCLAEYACYYAARYEGFINGINKACLADYACYKAAYGGGSIHGAGISKACLTPSSCYGVAFSEALESNGITPGPEISSGITNCVCDTCAGALDDESLPDECGDKLEFVGELLNELEDIIKSKIGN